MDGGHQPGGTGSDDDGVVVEGGHRRHSSGGVLLTIVATGLYVERMHFANPEFLVLLPLAAVVVWWWVRRPRPAVRFSDTSLFAESTGRRAWRVRWLGGSLRGLTCLAVIVGCAGPRWPDERTRLPAEAIAILMVLDVSGSMETLVPWAVNEPPVTRLEAARRAFKLFVAGGTGPDGTVFEARPADQIGLIAFAIIPQTACVLTLNHSVLLKEVDALKPWYGVSAGTNVGDAIAQGLIHLEAAQGVQSKVMILLSDGQHIQSNDAMLRPLQAAQLAANLGYTIYTIDVGGDPALIPDPADRAEREQGRQTLQAVARMTGGRCFTADAGSEMLAAFREIDTLERTVVVAPQYRRYFEYYPWCAGAAVGLLVLTHLLDRTRWRLVP
jgi:Ca-activated chloride channel family protein